MDDANGTRVLVVGGTGTVGSQVLTGLLARGVEPRVMTRSARKIQNLPTNVWGAVADLARPETLSAAFDGIERVVMVTALSPTEADEGRAAVAAAKQAGVRRFVFVSVYGVEACPDAPHFRSKLEIERALRDAGIPHTVVMPNNFFQNDLALREPIERRGVYPAPLGGVGLSRVDARDVAHALVNAVLDEGHEGKRYPLVGPEVLDGAAVAAAWGRALGRDVRYGGDDLDAWEARVRPHQPDWMVDDLRIMFAFFQEQGLRATAADLDAQAPVLGRSPRRFDDFAAETARAWKG